jgi:hypothetical protein
MPKQAAPAPEPFRLGHDALAGLTVGPEAQAVQEAGGLVHFEGEHFTKPEPYRVIDPKGDALKPGTKIE